MPKKEKVRLQHSEDLDSVDQELGAAMDLLDQTNERVHELLRAYEPPPPETPKAGESSADTAAEPPSS